MKEQNSLSGDENEVVAADPAEMEFLDNELLTLEKKFKNFEAKVKGQLKSQSEKVNQVSSLLFSTSIECSAVSEF